MKRLFVSYARENKAAVDELVRHLDSLDYDSWVDSSLRGGQSWWDEILQRITDSDAFVAIVSRASLNSVACIRELEWARALGKPVLPVAVQTLPEALPRYLSMLHIVDYSQPGQDAAFALAGALAALPLAPPVPANLPDKPPAPLSYLTDLIDQVSQEATLTHEQQREILLQLQPALRSADPEERHGGRYVLETFSRRDDLYADVDRTLIQWGITEQKEHESASPTAQSAAAVDTLKSPPAAQRAAGAGEPAVTTARRPPIAGSAPRRPRGPAPYPPSQAAPPPSPSRRHASVKTQVSVIVAGLALVAVVAWVLIWLNSGRDRGDSEVVPSNAKACPTAYSTTEFPTSAIGNDTTSCPFAEEVRRQYINQSGRNTTVTVDALSPVTGQMYRMTCSGHRVVKCTGGNDAVVYIY